MSDNLASHLLNTNQIILNHHTRCGMLAFTDDLLKVGLEGYPAAEELIGKATGREFVSCNHSCATPDQFHAFRGSLEALDSPPTQRIGCPVNLNRRFEEEERLLPTFMGIWVCQGVCTVYAGWRSAYTTYDTLKQGIVITPVLFSLRMGNLETVFVSVFSCLG